MIKKISINHIRCIKNVVLYPSECINIIYGGNGSGKTSLLEAINILGGMKLFKPGNISNAINNSAVELTVSADISLGGSKPCLQLGISRSKVKKYPEVKLNGNRVYTIDNLTKVVPMQAVTPSSFQFLEGSSKYRRGMLDWGVFHVKHSLFFPLWKKTQSLVQQRNALLKKIYASGDSGSLKPWDLLLTEAAEKIDLLRKSYFEKITPIFYDVLYRLQEGLQLNMIYYRGWEDNKAISQVFDECRGRDIKQGYTSFGPHKADVFFKIATSKTTTKEAVSYLSRGQIKLVVYAFKIAQAVLLEKSTSKKCIFLIDDLSSELEEKYIKKVLDMLTNMRTQVFLTVIEKEKVKHNLLESIATEFFHIQQGSIKNN